MDTLRRKPVLKCLASAILAATLAIIITGCGGGGGGGDSSTPNTVWPATANVTGKVIDSYTSIALSGRHVMVTEGGVTQTADTAADGSFTISGVSTASTITLTISENTASAATPFYTTTLTNSNVTVSGSNLIVNLTIPYSQTPPGPPI